MREQQRRYWSKLIAEQEASGQKARPFCRERGIGEWSFYKWRSRLRQADTVEFALLETAPAAVVIPDSALELVLRNGERLRIANGVDAAALRLVLDPKIPATSLPPAASDDSCSYRILLTNGTGLSRAPGRESGSSSD